MKSPSEIIESLDIPDGNNIKACEDLIHSELKYYTKAYAEAFISNDLKTRCSLNKTEVKYLIEFYTLEKKANTEEEKEYEVSFAEIGDFVLRKFSIFTMRDTGEIYIYKNVVYKNEGSTKLNNYIRRLCKKNYEHLANTVFIREVIAYIQAYTYVDREDVDKGEYINFKNGLYSLETGELENHRRDYYSIRQISANYDINGKWYPLQIVW